LVFENSKDKEEQVKSSSPSDSSNEDNKRSKVPDYDDQKSDKVGDEKREQKTGEITINQVI
jgi:hypothetical protein